MLYYAQNEALLHIKYIMWSNKTESEEIHMNFISEIRQQAPALRTLVQYWNDTYTEDTEKIQALLARTTPTQILFVGMGSSLFASEIACTYLRRKGIRAYTLEANECLRFDTPVLDEHTLLVAVSQSGNSMETVRFCEQYRNSPLITVTNQEQGNLAKYGDVKIFLRAGDEHFTATKSYTNTVAALVYLAMQLAGDTDGLPVLYDEILKCADAIQTMVDDSVLPEKMADFLRETKLLTLVGSGASFATVEHGQLVMLEAARIQSFSYTAGQFIHGPVEVIDSAFGCIVFDFDPAVREETNHVISLTEKFGGRTLVITNRTDLPEIGQRMVLQMNCDNSFLAPLLEIIPIELWVKYTGEKKGYTPGVLHRVHK